MESKQKLTLNQMLGALDRETATIIDKRLKKLRKKKATKKPLSKHESDRLQRKVAYSEASNELSKWDPIVEENRKAEQLHFPLDSEPDLLSSAPQVASTLKPINKLETDILGAIDSSEMALPDRREFSKAEENYLKSISVEEAQERHRELQRMRVLLSSFAVKMKRQKKIKSKGYRRLLKHDKIRSHVKSVESDRDKLVREIERLKVIRAQERASLKHKNTGKWAKHMKFRSKYDEEARRAMLDQIGLAGKLLEKPASSESEYSDDDEDEVSLNEENQVASYKSGDANKTCSDRLIISSDLLETKAKKPDLLTGAGMLEAIMKGDDIPGDDQMSVDDEDVQRLLMKEAFAGDDVVAAFQEQKNEIKGEEQPKDIDNFLPGWGDWAGPGIKINKKKRKKYIIKAKEVHRRDENLGNVIISEEPHNHLDDRLVTNLPRGIRDDEHFERVMNRPVSATFVDQQKHRQRIKPKVVTKMGTRIEPLSRTKLKGERVKWC